MITKIKEILADQLDIELEDIKDNSDIPFLFLTWLALNIFLTYFKLCPVTFYARSGLVLA